MKTNLSGIFLNLFNPLIIPTLVIVIILSQPVFFSMMISLKSKLIISGIVFSGTCILPAILTQFYRNNPQWSVPGKNSREQRIYPIFMSGLLIFLTYYFLTYIELPQLYTMPFLFLTFVVATALVINFWWNISLELLAWGAFTGAMLSSALLLSFDVLIPLIVGLMISGISGAISLSREKYTPLQIYASWFAGMLLMLPAFYLV